MTAAAARADAVDDAYSICATFERTGLSSGCEVQGWGSTVDVTLDMNSGEARQACNQVAQMMSERTSNFADAGWKLQIFSPYGQRPIAQCNLR